MFWIFDQKSIENTGVFLAVAKQCLHKVKVFSASHTTPPESRLEMHKKLEGDTAGTTDPK